MRALSPGGARRTPTAPSEDRQIRPQKFRLLLEPLPERAYALVQDRFKTAKLRTAACRSDPAFHRIEGADHAGPAAGKVVAGAMTPAGPERSPTGSLVMSIHRKQLHRRLMAAAAWLCLAGQYALSAPQIQALNEEEMRNFLVSAKVIRSTPVKKGVTGISRLTLSDGSITHDAAFQSVDIFKELMVYKDGKTERNFRDSYHFNLAAYELARLVGLGDMVPVTVKRKCMGRDGSLSWWLDVQMDEGERSKSNIQPPDPEAYNRQMLKILTFGDLIYDTDQNPGNVLITKDWRLFMIDFTRAFRLETSLENLGDRPRCERNLLAALRSLKEEDVAAKTRSYLSREEIRAVMARRDRLVTHFERLISKLGEKSVLY